MLEIINMIKVTYQGQSENSTSFQFYVVHTVVQAGGLHSTEMRSCNNLILEKFPSIEDLLRMIFIMLLPNQLKLLKDS